MKITITYLFFLVSVGWGYAQSAADTLSLSFFEDKERKQIKKLRQQLSQQESSQDAFSLAQTYQRIDEIDSACWYYDMALHLSTNKQEKLLIIPRLIEIIPQQHFSVFNQKSFIERYQSLVSTEPDSISQLILSSIEAGQMNLNNNSLQAVQLYRKLLRKNIDSTELKFAWYRKLARIYLKTNQIDSVYFNLKKGLELSEKLEDKGHEFDILLDLSQLYLMGFGDKNEIENYLEIAKKTKFQDHQLKRYDRLYTTLMQWHRHHNQNERALKYAEAKNVTHLLINQKIQKNGFRTTSETYQIQEKNKRLRLYDGFIKTYKKYKPFFIGGLIFSIALSLYSVLRWKREDFRRKNSEDEHKKLETQHKLAAIEKEKTALEKTKVDTEMEQLDSERERLSQDKNRLEINHSQYIEELNKLQEIIVKDHIVLRNKHKINLKHLIYIQSDGHYLRFVTEEEKDFIRGNLNEVVKEMPSNFIRVHRSYCVNLNFVKKYNGKEIHLRNETDIPISRTYKEEFEHRLKDYLD